MTFYLNLKSFVEENSLENVVSDMADIFISASMCFNHKKMSFPVTNSNKKSPHQMILQYSWIAFLKEAWWCIYALLNWVVFNLGNNFWAPYY